MTSIIVGTTQMACCQDRRTNLEKAEALVRDAAAQGARIVLLQELFETLYFCQVENADSFSLATSLEMIGLLLLMRLKLGGLEGRRVWSGVLHALLGATAMGLVLAGWLALGGSLPDWLATGGGMLLGGLVYVLVMLALGVPEARGLLQALRRRLR